MTAAEFTVLVQKHQGLVYTVCRQLTGDDHIAQDLAQETFLSAWKSIDRCPPGAQPQWLARIAANKAKDYLKSAWHRRVNAPGDEILALSGAPPESQPERQLSMRPVFPGRASSAGDRRPPGPAAAHREQPDCPGQADAAETNQGKERRKQWNWNCLTTRAALPMKGCRL